MEHPSLLGGEEQTREQAVKYLYIYLASSGEYFNFIKALLNILYSRRYHYSTYTR
jgi:hypothetical protein